MLFILYKCFFFKYKFKKKLKKTDIIYEKHINLVICYFVLIHLKFSLCSFNYLMGESIYKEFSL